MLLDFAGAGNPLGAQGTIAPKPTSVLQVERCIFRVFKEHESKASRPPVWSASWGLSEDYRWWLNRGRGVREGHRFPLGGRWVGAYMWGMSGL